ncbi:response regulator [Heliorestis acidaminivorans]|uniref:Circadian input-output histidine kinase CikA n=1 Tax=Heliorestis acidaminivorans TaxID=553427 RepID=A0A6I0EYG3_9FIRM|nr:hybrid sensor histidine kinase/response regulator [Heliorestis acidaminivorans]KAB2953451.1 response regulator [Heliorestis acidaminivorans]
MIGPQKIRRGLFFRIAMTMFFIIILFSYAVLEFIINPAMERVADSEIRQSSTEIQDKVDEFFSSAERQLFTARDYTLYGFLAEDDLNTFTELFMPALRHNEALSALFLAREDSQERILFQDVSGWRSRLTFPERYPGTATWLYWDDEGKLFEEKQITSDYDCRTRPWFIGAMSIGEEEVFWTDPYIFFTKEEPGITASLPFKDQKGTQYVLGIDVSLRDLSRLTSSTTIGERGYVAVLDREGKVIGLPSFDSLPQPMDQSLVVHTVAELGDDSLLAGYSSWSKGEWKANELIRYSSNGEVWLALFTPITLGKHNFFVATFVPESQFAHERERWLLAMTLLMVTVIGLSFLLSNEISKRISKPLRQLLEQSERIGNLDFSPTPFKKTEWEEINRLADAQEEMRRMIREATENLEDTVRARTFELHKLSQAIEQNPVTIVITDKDGTIEYVNPNFCKITGYSQEEAIGANPRILKSDLTPQSLFKELWTNIKAGQEWRGELINKKKNGELYWENLVIAPLTDEKGEITHFVAIQEDISDLKKAQKDLLDQLAFIEKLIDDIPNPIFYRDSDGKFLGCNKAYEAALGVKGVELIGKTTFDMDFFPKEYRDHYEQQVERVIREGTVFHDSLQLPFSDGKLHDVLFWISGFRLSDGSPGGLTGIIVDVSELRQKEEELRQARREAEEATEAKSMFLANMSHEIRTPMNAIIGMAYLTLKTELTAKQRDYVGKIYNAGTALLQIINDILDFSKIESDNLSMEQIDFFLDDVMQTVVDFNCSKASEKGLEFLYHIPADLPRNLVGDPLRLGQVLTNLVNNALKFTSEGLVSVDVQLLERKNNKVQLQFNVSDTGIGLSPEVADKLFQPFTQADGSTTRKHGGTGLGLSISKRLVEMMDGTIGVESKLGVGSRFTFNVWFELSEVQQQERTIIPEVLNNMRMLVVDDNPMAQEILIEYLQSAGFRVDAAVSGEEALAILQREQQIDPFGLIFLDWQMPGINGLEVARLIKESYDSASMPAIVMISAFDREELRQKTEELSLEGLLIKPIGQSMLIDKIVEIFAPAKGSMLNSFLIREVDYNLAGLQVLLAEDNEVNQQIAVELLQGQGISVDVVATGKEAVDKIFSTDENNFYDLVLLDLEMPEMDGFEAAQIINKAYPDLPLIALTAWAMERERDRCFAVGMKGHVLKPIDPQVLFTTLAKFNPHKGIGKEFLPTRPFSRGTEPIDSDLQSIRGIDAEEGLKRLVGNGSLYKKLLRQFAENQKEAPAILREALRENDKALATRIAHTVKGVAANLGAYEVSKASAAIEESLRKSEKEAPLPEDFQELLHQFSQQLEQVIEGIQSQLREESAPKAQIDYAKVAPQLAKLKTFLSEYDSEAIDFFDSQREGLLQHCKVDAIVQLEKAIKNFEFDKALSILSDLDVGDRES